MAKHKYPRQHTTRVAAPLIDGYFMSLIALAIVYNVPVKDRHNWRRKTAGLPNPAIKLHGSWYFHIDSVADALGVTPAEVIERLPV